MNRWKILKRAFSHKKAKPRFAINVQYNLNSEIIGEVFIGENTNIGKSKIISKNGSAITIGKNTNIRDFVLIFSEKPNNLFIGNNVFISNGVEIYGPAVISDETFVGNKTMIVNSDIGKGCLIEDNVLIKDVVIPSNLVIPSRSVIDSSESLNELINSNSYGAYCEVFYKEKESDLL